MFQMRKFFASKVEWKYIYQLMESIDEKNIRNYVTNQIEWYVIKADRYRLLEYALKILTVVMPTLVTIAQQCLDTNCWMRVMILGAATITSASGTFLKIHDKRILYRKAAEQLKDETMLYVTYAEPYRGDNRNEIFVTRLYEITQNVNKKWNDIEEKNENTKNENTNNDQSLSK